MVTHYSAAVPIIVIGSRQIVFAKSSRSVSSEIFAIHALSICA